MAEHISALNLSFMNLSNLEQQIRLNKASGPFLYINVIFKPMGKWKVGFRFHVSTFQLSCFPKRSTALSQPWQHFRILFSQKWILVWGLILIDQLSASLEINKLTGPVVCPPCMWTCVQEQMHAPLHWLTNVVKEPWRLECQYSDRLKQTVPDLMLPLGFSHTD